MDLNYIINKLINEMNLNIKCKENKINLYVLETLDEEFLIRIITPHSGNNFNFIIRAEYSNNFDKWSNATYEEYFKNESDLSKIIKDLKNIIKHKDKTLLKEYDEYNIIPFKEKYCIEIFTKELGYVMILDLEKELTPKYFDSIAKYMGM